MFKQYARCIHKIFQQTFEYLRESVSVANVAAVFIKDIQQEDII